MDNIRLAFLLGAGASVDSGLPTYRGLGGLYNQGDIQPEKLLTPSSFRHDPQRVWEFLLPLYHKYKEIKPGPTYQQLDKLTKKYPSFILTQNVDGFIKDLIAHSVELHGNMQYAHCPSCGYKEQVVSEPPKCTKCDKLMKPNIVLFGESLNHRDIELASKFIKSRPTYFIIVGTGLHFPYLRNLVNRAKHRGAKVIHINPDPNYGSNVKLNEEWIKADSYSGLVTLEKRFEEMATPQSKTLEERVSQLESNVTRLILESKLIDEMIEH